MIEVSRFWRDPALPFVEARRVGDGRKVCYAAHSHESFSIGVITGGRSTYINSDQCVEVGAGTTVLMNPGVVHTCNPVAGEPWSYLMLFVDQPWLQAVGFTLPTQTWRRSPVLYGRLLQDFDDLFDARLPDRETRLAALFSELPGMLARNASEIDQGNPRLDAAAAFIRAHRSDPLSLEDICGACGLSRSYLIRAFRQRFGLTPHEYDLIRTLPDSAHCFLIKRGGESVVVRLDLSGEKDILTILSGRERSVRLLDDIRASVYRGAAGLSPSIVPKLP